MHVDSMELVWIVVKDLKQAITFYTETVGLKLMEHDEKFGWAELQGHNGGARLGIAQLQEDDGQQAGQNAVITFTVKNLEKAKDELEKRGAKCRGAIQE